METALINTSVALFSICAQVIMFLLVFFLRREKKEKPLILKNGIPAVATIMLLLIYLFRQHIQEIESAVLFTIAVSTALILVAKDQDEYVPKWMELANGVIFMSGFVFLVLFTYTHH
jgi:4-amino-4-deoxy-L-arabinose transferase-like glycosyltransferase